MLRKNANLQSVAKEANRKAFVAYDRYLEVCSTLMNMGWSDQRRNDTELMRIERWQRFKDMEEIGRHLCRLAGIEWEDPQDQ